MASIDVAFTPDQAGPADVTAVIDVIRATSTMTQALASGYRRVLAAESLDRARSLAAPGRVLAGEVRCLPPEDFDLGNSPGDVAHPRGEDLILATTNGAPAMVRAADLSPVVFAASLLNLRTVIEALAGFERIQILCSGTHRRVSIDDSYVAGRIAEGLAGSHSDAALVAMALAGSYPRAREALGAGQAARLLEDAGLVRDLDWCARESVLDVLPRVTGTAEGVALLEVHSGSSMGHEGHIAGKLSLERLVSAPEPRTNAS